jgi:hypothetical protein
MNAFSPIFREKNWEFLENQGYDQCFQHKHLNLESSFKIITLVPRPTVLHRNDGKRPHNKDNPFFACSRFIKEEEEEERKKRELEISVDYFQSRFFRCSIKTFA